LIKDDTIVLYSKHVIGQGKELFEVARKKHLEGIIGKRRDSTYQERRSRDWVKIKTSYEQEFVVGGWTEPKGSRKGFGALLLGVYEKKGLRYVGSVGTGFTVKRLSELYARLQKIERKSSPFVNASMQTRRRIGARRSSSPRCVLPSGRATVISANPRTSACGWTSRPPMSSRKFRWTRERERTLDRQRRCAHALALQSR
jgi:ATP-dependent DNA ligase